MLLKPIHQDTHTIIPQLDTTIVQRCREKRLSRMKSKPWFRNLSDNIAYCNLSKLPLTRLLFDSNFVSITDMLVYWATSLGAVDEIGAVLIDLCIGCGNFASVSRYRQEYKKYIARRYYKYRNIDEWIQMVWCPDMAIGAGDASTWHYHGRRGDEDTRREQQRRTKDRTDKTFPNTSCRN